MHALTRVKVECQQVVDLALSATSALERRKRSVGSRDFRNSRLFRRTILRAYLKSNKKRGVFKEFRLLTQLS